MRTHAVVRSLTKGRGIDHCTFYQCKVHLPHEVTALNWPIVGVKAHHTIKSFHTIQLRYVT